MSKSYYLLILIIFVGYLLRIQFLPKNILTFGYDQARDAVQALAISKGDIKILGPSASTPGLFHGVMYYYLLAPAYLIGKGNPIVAAYWIAFLNVLTTIIIYYLTYLFTKCKTPALIASMIFAVSFEASQYATWLSNPTVGIWTVPLIYLGLWLWTETENKRFGSLLAAFGLALSIQAEIFLVYHTIPGIIWLLNRAKKISYREITTFVITLILGLFSMIIVEFKFGFRSLEGIKLLLLNNEVNLAYTKSLGDYLNLYLNQIGRIFAFNTYPGNIGYGGAVIIVCSLYFWLGKKRKNEAWPLLLVLWLFSHIWVVTVGGTTTPFLMVGIGPAVSILLGILIWSILQKNKFVSLIFLLIIIWGNLSYIYKENPKGATLFAIQKDMLLSKQLLLIDETYKLTSDGKMFSINTLNSPLWINIVWAYLYQWYGQSHYQYVPNYAGRDQVDQIISLPQTEKINTDHYLILEPMGGIPLIYNEDIRNFENSRSTLMFEKKYGELILQKRSKLKIYE